MVELFDVSIDALLVGTTSDVDNDNALLKISSLQGGGFLPTKAITLFNKSCVVELLDVSVDVLLAETKCIVEQSGRDITIEVLVLIPLLIVELLDVSIDTLLAGTKLDVDDGNAILEAAETLIGNTDVNMVGSGCGILCERLCSS